MNNSYTPEAVPINVKYVKDLHAKVYWFVNYGVYIGSANCTEDGWYKNLEYGVWFPHKKLEDYHIRDLKDFFKRLEKKILKPKTVA